MQKTIILLRHAKAEAGHPGQEDFDRGLIERGVAAASAIGGYLRQQHIAPQKVLCSSARRTRETLAHAQVAYGKLLPVDYSDTLYHASAEEMLGMFSYLPETLGSVLLVGHNPGLHQLCLKLAASGERELLDTMRMKFPTCTLATLTLDALWEDITETSGKLTGFVTPKMLGLVEE